MALVGNLKDIKLPTLVQINCMERNTAKLTIEHMGRFGFIYFHEGQVVHAEYDPLIGEEAFFKLLELYSGNFKVETEVRAPAITIKKNWNNLLLEGLHKRDSCLPDSKFNYNKLMDALFNVKGLEQVLIIDQSGNIVGQSEKQEVDVNLILFHWYEAQKISQELAEPNPRYLLLNQGGRHQFLIQLDKNLLLVIYLVRKIQPELILSVIRETLKIAI